ncbi:MAG: folate-binding protein, partial [Pseudomonadota bacterium]|nr:folate-binding protein [Pseudomonadota bacterium]
MNNCQLFDLTDLGLIRASGDDCELFLQGQLTNDITEVTPERSQLSGYCTPKGRLLATMRVISHDGDFLLLMPKERLAPVLQRLGMFILMSKVTLSDASDELQTIGLYGDCTISLPAGDMPAQADDCVAAADGVTIVRIAAEAQRFLLIGSAGAIAQRWQLLTKTTIPATKELWQLQDIRAGLPTVFEATVEAFVPQMLNMHLVNGVSFTKGCYTGQEIVARMHYLGKLKRRMYHIAVEGECPASGADLYSPQSQSGQGSGKIVMSAASKENA